MARIPEADIERLKNEIAVQRLVETTGVVLKKSGKDFTGICPFHADETASLVVTPSRVPTREVAHGVRHQLPFLGTTQDEHAFQFQEQQRGRGFHAFAFIGLQHRAHAMRPFATPVNTRL